MLTLANQTFTSRLLLGTGKFSSSQALTDAVNNSKTEMVTMALKRVDPSSQDDDILAPLHECGVNLLPNTSGARTAEEAVFAAQLAREALGTSFLKLEIHPDPRYLMPDPVETLKAAEILAKQGFHVLPYIHADPVICRRLEDAGCAAVMPLAAPIGSNLGLRTKDFIQIIIESSQVPVIVDAGIGSPSDAAEAMEMGADAVLVNTAIAVAGDPAAMADAFRMAVIAGRQAYKAGLGGRQLVAEPSSPLTAFLD
ncbi:thiazole synthase [Parendozoicomonas sp. Alg238-R29]|uniref:thiazole synthase n=1 Tax=Parendozoicomonas sp. Alg238-R29 TaxID=2993446 RepID=UPI00248F2C47|nr:thiazole synthase [Parendozoicomonas sp. Alg238-R29]